MAQNRGLIFPQRYLQGPNVVPKELYNLASGLGKVGAFAIVDEFILDNMKDLITKSFEGKPLPIELVRFQKESCMTEINRCKALLLEKKYDVVIGIGGGKTMDTAKAVGFYTDLPTIIVPTTASTDAPTSALAIIYSDAGVFEKYLFLKHNPNVVLVDTDIISKAPVRTLVAGIGDALATYYEARATKRSNKNNMVHTPCSVSALALALQCRDTLFADGLAAKAANELKQITPALENIVEANTLLSGIGFESGGLAAAHAVHDGLTALHETHKYLHGEKVAFGLIVQLVLENSPKEEFAEVLNFCHAVGLPTTLKDLGVESVTSEQLLEVARRACIPEETIHNLPFPVCPESVAAAIIVADKLGAKK